MGRDQNFINLWLIYYFKSLKIHKNCWLYFNDFGSNFKGYHREFFQYFYIEYVGWIKYYDLYWNKQSDY